MDSASSDDDYSFAIGCPLCGEVVVFSCTREKIRGNNPVNVSCTYWEHSWALSADEKEYFGRQINTSF
jgi:hypothetical protein